jgi:hypothetical protein
MTLEEKVAVLEVQVRGLLSILGSVEGGNHRRLIRALEAEVTALNTPKVETLDEKKRRELDYAALGE